MNTSCQHSGFCIPEIANAALNLFQAMANTPGALDKHQLARAARDILEAYQQADHDEAREEW